MAPFKPNLTFRACILHQNFRLAHSNTTTTTTTATPTLIATPLRVNSTIEIPNLRIHPSTGSIKMRLRHTSLFPAKRLVSTRANFLSNPPSNLDSLPPKKKNRAIAASAAVQTRVDDSDMLHAHLAVPVSKSVTRALMAPRDVARIRKLRKAIRRDHDGRKSKLQDMRLEELVFWVRKNVEEKDPVVGWEGEGKRWVARGRTKRTSCLGFVKSVEGGEVVEGKKKSRGEKEVDIQEREMRFWGGYVALGQGVIEDVFEDVLDFGEFLEA